MPDKHIVLGLEGVFMSYGTDSMFFIKNTDSYPSKSAIIGMICAAMGEANPSADLLCDLNGCMEVDGYTSTNMTVYTDMQNMGAGYDKNDPFMRKRRLARTNKKTTNRKGEVSSVESLSTSKISHRDYLGDVKYRVILSLPGLLADRVITALNNPVHGPFLGRKACAPTNKVFRSVHTNKREAMAVDLFGPKYNRFIAVRDGHQNKITIDGDDITDLSYRIVNDVPRTFDRLNRTFASRQITYYIVPNSR